MQCLLESLIAIVRCHSLHIPGPLNQLGPTGARSGFRDDQISVDDQLLRDFEHVDSTAIESKIHVARYMLLIRQLGSKLLLSAKYPRIRIPAGTCMHKCSTPHVR